MKELLPTGTRIYYGGDMANFSHFGVISQVKTDRWGTEYEITPDHDEDQEITKGPYWVNSFVFSERYSGNGSTRFVTEKAYDDWRQEQLGKLF